MPRQLIFTSAPRGLTPGQSGYCTVARSRDLRDALIPAIEKLSYYTPETNHNPIICAHRILDIRGTKIHVLTRIVDAGHDFTKRRSFLAHHLILEPSELASSAAPAEIFLKWKGWIDHWEGDPQWLEDNRPLPARTSAQTTLPKSDHWISGNEADRKNFLQTLSDRGADWDITFTNCFQPGDHPDDFDFKAAWPNTPGYAAAQRLCSDFVRLDQLPTPPNPSIAISSPPATQPRSTSAPAPVTAPDRKLTVSPILPIGAIAVTIVAFLVTLYLRHRIPDHPVSTPTPRPAPARTASAPSELDNIFPLRPTWLLAATVPSTIPPADELMRELRANEIFTKNLTASIQPNLLSPPIPASLFAQPDRNLLRFDTTNIPPIELNVSNSTVFKTDLENAFAVEIPGRFRVLAIKTPLQLPVSYLTIDTNIELHPDFAQRIHRIELPSGSQLALRPLVKAKIGWIDPLAQLEHDFALIPSTVLDLPAVEAHAHQIIADKETKLRAYETEAAALAEDQKKVLTEPTPDQLKAKDRLATLDLAIPKARQELESLSVKAASIPHDSTTIDRFALFLCLSNVNTEVIRFTDKP